MLNHHKVVASTLLLCLSPTQNLAAPLDAFRDCDACPEMVELPLGDFLMGAPEDEFRNNLTTFYQQGKMVQGQNDPSVIRREGPQHRVVVDILIAIGKNEITYAEWMACVNDGGCDGSVARDRVYRNGSYASVETALTDPKFTHVPSEAYISEAISRPGGLKIGDRYPVLYITYSDAQSYVRWLNGLLNTDAYRLPTEAEWEYAARAGTETRFAQGFEPTPNQANISGELTEFYELRKRPDLRTFGFPVPVDELDADNPWGIRHMSGNATEITLSCYNERYEDWRTTSEWLENSFLEDCDRIQRGGAFDTPMSEARVAYRRGSQEIEGSQSSGFRVVKELK